MPLSRITSVQNPRVKGAAHLRDARHRRKQGRIIIDGLREITRAAAAGVPLIEVFVNEEKRAQLEASPEWIGLSRCGSALFAVPAEVFSKIAYGQRDEGIAAVAERPSRELNRLTVPAAPLVAILEEVEKPGNVGAVFRGADGAGLSAVIVAGRNPDLFNPNAIRASLGTVFTLPAAEAGPEEALAWARRQGLQIVAARVEGAVDYTAIDYRRPTAIVLGSEAEGLSPLWRADDITAVGLPMRGSADSLNVSAAAAVLFYEALRQRDGGGASSNWPR